MRTILTIAVAALAVTLASAPGGAQQQVLGAQKPAGDPGRGDEPGAGGVRPFAPKSGEEVYRAVCQACHMADAKGGQGAGMIPALAANPRLAQPAYPITLVAKGRGAMPWFNDTLTPTQVAAVVTYIRTHFGNSYKGVVTPEEVVRIAGPFSGPGAAGR